MKLFWMLMMLSLTTAHAEVAAAASAGAVWVPDPAVPGPDLPAAGRSLFDRVTTDASAQRRIPYPFERLIERIEAAAGCPPAAPCTRAVLIPLGRSLQRTAASPDFYRHPRIVAGVVGEGSGLMLRDRLYLGFHDRAQVIEVISYNEAAGRFEFQVVRNYAPGQVPEVTYARRTLCVACHQNHGPIFSQPVWLETNANPLVATRLEQERSSFFGVAARTTTDVAQAIDDATDRATALALVQRLWSDGCGQGERFLECRRGALIAAMQSALTGGRAYDRSAEFRQHVVGALARSAAERWPQGLALPDADIANRDPMNVHAGTRGTGQVNIAPPFDPLVPRPPRQIVPTDGPQLADLLVRGMTDFWPARSIAALDGALQERGRHLRPRRLVLRCQISGAAAQGRFECADAAGRLRGEFDRTTGIIEELATADRQPVRHLRLHSGQRAARGASVSVTFRVADELRHARLADGSRIERISLQWPSSSGKPAEGTATLEVIDDFVLAEQIVADLEPDEGPLQSSLLGEIAARIRGETLRHATAGAADAIAEVKDVSMEIHPAALQFEAPCGSCHRTVDVTPPNFLTGDARRVEAALKSCAARIYVRLAMRDVEPARRAKSPMPPEYHSSLRTGTQAADTKALVELRAAVETLLIREYGQRPDLDDLLRQGYEALPPCLPAS